MRVRDLGTRIAIYLLIVIVLAITIFPIYWLVTTSFKERVQSLTVPPVWVFKPTFEGYYKVVTGEMGAGFEIFLMQSLMASAIISSATTALAIVLGSLAGYGLSRFRFWGTNYISLAIISTRMIPPMAYILPLYTIMNRIKLLDTYPGLILAYSTITLPYATWIMFGFFKSVSTSLDDAAMIDGCSRFGALMKVILPISRTGLVATGIYCFMIAWQEFLVALIIGGTEIKPMTVTLSLFIGQREVFWNELAAAGVLVILPIFIILITAQKHLIKGLMTGAVKE